MPTNTKIPGSEQNTSRKADIGTPIIHDPSSPNKTKTPCLDTVGIAYKCEAVERVEGCTETVHQAGTERESVRWTRKLPGGGFASWGMGGRCWVEASVPKAAGGDNIEALGVGQALDVMRELFDQAGELVPPARELGGHRFEGAKVVRLDLVRDFDGIENLPGLLDSLSEQARPLRWKASRFSDAGRSGSATLSVGPRAWKATLYDKHAETRGAAPEGRLRFEARLHHDQLVSKGARAAAGDPLGSTYRVSDIDETNLLDLRRWVFDRVGYGKEIMATDQLRQRVFRPVDPVSLRDIAGLTKREQRELWAFLTAGEHLCGFSRNVRSKYRRIADELGVTLDQAEEAAPAVTARLDYDTGRQLLGVAA